jgi:hypothetical protein
LWIFSGITPFPLQLGGKLIEESWECGGRRLFFFGTKKISAEKRSPTAFEYSCATPQNILLKHVPRPKLGLLKKTFYIPKIQY